jgi:hypothetical protein
MSENQQVLKDNRNEISSLAGQTLKLLTLAGPSESPARYQAVIRNATALAEIWSRHIRNMDAVLPLVMASDLHFLKMFDRMMDDNMAIARRLKRLASSAWPRSSQFGLSSIRSLATETLKLVLRQLEREETMMEMLPRHPKLTPALLRPESASATQLEPSHT